MPLRSRGFSLVEVVVAAAVLLVACVAVSRVVSVSLASERSIGRRAVVEDALEAECQHLAALPYWCPASPPPPGGQVNPTSLLGDVFPHALGEYNLAQAYFSEPTFVTTRVSAEVCLRTVARFVVVDGEGEHAVAGAGLRGWAVWSGSEPPASSLAVTVQASLRGSTSVRRLLLTGLRPSVEPSQGTPVGGG
jgi:prepilin-type N-terminal cleavage/methylation domain-containing protein